MAELSLAQRTMYAMLVLSVYVVPLPFGHVGADVTSSVARMAVALTVASVGVPAADVTEDLTSRVSLLAFAVVAVVPSDALEELAVWVVADFDGASVEALFNVAFVDSLLTGHTTPASQAFFEQHPRKPFA